MNAKEFKKALDNIVKEKDIDPEVVYEAMELALTSAYKKNFNSKTNVKVLFDRQTGEIKVYSFLTVVPDDKMTKEEYKIYLHEKDIDLVNEPGSMAKMCGVEVEKFFPDIVITNECSLNIIGYKIKVLCTPGHTQGGVIYILDNIMFSGDTIFRGSIGRFDFPESDYNDIIKSVKRVLSMEGDYIILPGHGSSTTLDLERKINVVNE